MNVKAITLDSLYTAAITNSLNSTDVQKPTETNFRYLVVDIFRYSVSVFKKYHISVRLFSTPTNDQRI